MTFQSAGRIIGWLNSRNCWHCFRQAWFQSAGRIIGWLNLDNVEATLELIKFQSAGRIIGWLNNSPIIWRISTSSVSIRRADYWLVEGRLTDLRRQRQTGFNPPGGLLVG